jgi:hypothetical protein
MISVAVCLPVITIVYILREHYVTNRLPESAKNPTAAVKRFKWEFEKRLAPLAEKRLGAISRTDVKQLHLRVRQDAR